MPLHFSTSSFCCKILFHLAQIVDDKLAGTASTAAGMLQIPTVPQYPQFLPVQFYIFLLEEVVDNIQIFILSWFQISNDKPEPVGQGNGLVDTVISKQPVLSVRPIPPGFPNEMTAVGGGINQHIFRAGFHAALDGGF